MSSSINPLGDEPIAFFITWTVYGTHLQGDDAGWQRRRKGHQPPQPRLAAWHERRLSHTVVRLSLEQRDVLEEECRRHCRHRQWTAWAISARSSHVHAVVTAPGYSGKVVRDQLKANGTRGLRERWTVFRDRPVWTVGGDWDCLNTEEELERACVYVLEAQDRKGVECTEQPADQPAGASPRFDQHCRRSADFRTGG